MSVLVTGSKGTFHPARAIACGTRRFGGVAPGQLTEAFRIIATDPNAGGILAENLGGSLSEKAARG